MSQGGGGGGQKPPPPKINPAFGNWESEIQFCVRTPSKLVHSPFRLMKVDQNLKTRRLCHCSCIVTLANV